MSPANRVSSARSRLATTITAHVCIHAGQHCLPHAADGQTERPTGPTITGQTERPIWARALRRRCDDADEPSQGTPVLRIASDDEPAVHRHPRWVQQPVTAHRHPPLAESGRAIRRSRAGTVSDPWTTRAVSAVTVKGSFSGDPRWRAQVLVTGTCHVWMGAVGTDGYGRIAIRNPEDGPRTLTPHQVGRGQARVRADPRRRDPLACLRAGRPGRLPSAPWRWPTSSSSSLPCSRSRWFCSTPGSTSRQRTEPAPRASTRTGSPAASRST